MSLIDLALAAGPILLLVYWMTKRKPMRSARALPLAAAVAYFARLGWFGTDPNEVNASVVAGLLAALTPIMIVWGAIFLFRTMEHCGAMDTIRRWLNHVSRNRAAQVVIIGWSFSFLIEGASGFGTPAALAGPLLVGLGFPALRVAMACLILNSIPVSFGAVGTPTWFGFGQLGLSAEEMREVAWKTALLQCAAAAVVPLLAFRLLLSWQEIRRNLLFIYLALAASVVPMALLALVNVEFPSVAGGLVGLVAAVALARHQVGLAPAEQTAGDGGAAPPPWAMVKALFPIWGAVLVLLLTRIPALGLRGLLTAETPAWDFPLGSFGHFSISPALVLGLRGIFGTDTDWTHQVLYVPSLLPFVLIAAVSWALLAAPPGVARTVWRESAESMRDPVVTLLGALVFVRVLMVGGDSSAALIIGRSLAAATGEGWQFAAAYLGAVGSFFAGSNTVSNLTFGPIQDAIAAQMGLERTTILALQSTGGAMGNMVAIHNIVAVCSVLGIRGQEGAILKQTVAPMLLYGVIAAAASLFL